MKKIKKIGLCMISLCLLLSSVVVNAATAHLYMPIVSQAPYYESACWAASGASICQSRGNYVTKEQFATKSGYPITQTQSIRVIGNTLNSYGIVTGYQSGFMNFNSVQSHVDQGKPMAVNVFRHAVVLEGYVDDNIGNPQTIFMDPYTSRYDMYRHNDLYSGSEGYKWVDAALVYN